jgi:hypothetical protein
MVTTFCSSASGLHSNLKNSNDLGSDAAEASQFHASWECVAGTVCTFVKMAAEHRARDRGSRI